MKNFISMVKSALKKTSDDTPIDIPVDGGVPATPSKATLQLWKNPVTTLIEKKTCPSYNQPDVKVDLPFVQVSTDYSMFQFLDRYNRRISESHIRKIMASIIENGLLRFVVVVKTKVFSKGKKTVEYYIIDGQHLYKALKFMGLPIYYIVIESENRNKILEMMSKMNSTSRNWVLGNYTKMHTENEKEMIKEGTCKTRNYQFITKLQEKSEISYSVLLQIFVKNYKGNARELLKSGKFAVQNKEDGIKMVRDMRSVRAKVKPSRYSDEGYLHFRWAIGKEYKHRKFLDMLDKYYDNTMPTFGKTKEALNFFRYIHEKYSPPTNA